MLERTLFSAIFTFCSVTKENGMEEHIYPKDINGKTYYYLQSTYRKKINADDSGKGPGTGKSRVCTNSEYLGSAKKIKKMLKA